MWCLSFAHLDQFLRAPKRLVKDPEGRPKNFHRNRYWYDQGPMSMGSWCIGFATAPPSFHVLFQRFQTARPAMYALARRRIEGEGKERKAPRCFAMIRIVFPRIVFCSSAENTAMTKGVTRRIFVRLLLSPTRAPCFVLGRNYDCSYAQKMNGVKPCLSFTPFPRRLRIGCELVTNSHLAKYREAFLHTCTCMKCLLHMSKRPS